ncbi:MAG: stage III sporulation protein AF [Syntrophothermus sp.]
MIEALSQWVKNLVTLVFIVTFLEMLTPDNDLKKFTRVVVGFFILVAVISPLLDLVRGGAAWPEPEELFSSVGSKPGSEPGFESGPQPDFATESELGSKLEATNTRQVAALYTGRLAEEVRAVVKEILPGWEARVRVGVSPEDGQITNLEVALRTPGGSEVPEIEVPEVAVTGRGPFDKSDGSGSSNQGSSEPSGQNDAYTAISERVRQRVASFTALSPEKVRVLVMR